MLAKINIEFFQNEVPDFSTIYDALCDALQAKTAFSEEGKSYKIIDPATAWAIHMVVSPDCIRLLLVGRIMDFATGVLLRVLTDLGGKPDVDLPSFSSMTLQEFTDNEDLDRWILRWTLEDDDGLW
jgi:hypothetical protein